MNTAGVKKWQVFIIAAVCMGMAVVFYQVWRNGRPEDSPPAPSDAELHRALEADAQMELTNAIYRDQSGVNRITEAIVEAHDANPTNWTAQATVDFVNHVGGVDRKTVFYRFGRIGMTNLYCTKDFDAQSAYDRRMAGGQ